VLSKFENFNRRLSNWCEWIGHAALLLMMVVTCIDVVGSKFFRLPLLGAIDIVQLSQIVAISFAASMAQLLGRHIQVEFVYKLMPQKAQAVLDSVVPLLGLGLFSVVVWRLFELGRLFQTTGEYTATAYIPLYPFAYALGFACIPMCMVLLMEFLKSLTKREKK
jgi:TRAP-type C4-dicarboxylate transport system permease small subunit